MNYLPSKELISEVLEIEIVDYYINENQVRINQLWHEDNPLNRELGLFNTSYGCKASINIYELAYKCKEWAYRQGYVLLSGYSAYGVGLFFCSCKGWLSENYDKQIEITNNTEPKAVFKATQWILDNKD